MPGSTYVPTYDYASVYKSAEGYASFIEWHEARLARLPVPCERITVATRAGFTHVLATGPGDAPSVVLLHSRLGSSLEWADQFGALAPHFRLYAPDLPGAPGLSVPARLDPDTPDYANWVGDLVQALGLGEGVNFVGTGAGAWVILKAAALTPELIGRAVLISPQGFVPLSTFPSWKIYWRGIRAVAKPTPANLRRYIQAQLGPKTRLDPARMEDGIALLGQALKNLHLPKPFLPLQDLELKRLQAPTLLLLGERDRLMRPKEVIRRAKKHLPRLQTDLIKGVGHAIPDERPDLINSYLLNFLAPEAYLSE